jgi:Spy/CpxP family protein refolding chaperone
MFALLSIGVGLCAGMLAERLLSAPAEPSGPSQRPSFKFGHHGPLRSVSGLADELSLDAAQRTEIERIVKEATDEMRRLESENRETESQAREAVLDVLTPAQREKLDAKQAREREEWRRRELDDEVRRWTVLLDLSLPEAGTLRERLGAVHKKKDEYFRDRCRDGARPSRDEVRAFFGTWRAEKTEAMRGALSPEQWKKYETLEKSDAFDGGK